MCVFTRLRRIFPIISEAAWALPSDEPLSALLSAWEHFWWLHRRLSLLHRFSFFRHTLISTRRNRPGTRGQMLATAVTPRLHLHTARAVLGRDWKRHVLLATCLGADLWSQAKLRTQKAAKSFFVLLDITAWKYYRWLLSSCYVLHKPDCTFSKFPCLERWDKTVDKPTSSSVLHHFSKTNQICYCQLSHITPLKASHWGKGEWPQCRCLVVNHHPPQC